MIRSVISSRAELLGAHTKTFARRYPSSPRSSGRSGGDGAGNAAPRGSGAASLGFENPPKSQGARRRRAGTPPPPPAASDSFGRRSLRSRFIDESEAFSSPAFASAAAAPASASSRVAWTPPRRAPCEGRAWRMTESKERTMRVLPVPGGPWIRVIGCFSSAARNASIWDSARGAFEERSSRRRGRAGEGRRASVSQMMGRCRTGERAKNRQKARFVFARRALVSRVRALRRRSEKPHVFCVITPKSHDLLSI